MNEYPRHWVYDTTLAQKDRLIVSKEMIRSPAFLDLTGAAKQLLLELYTRLRVEQQKANRRSGDGDRYYAKNNGKLVVSYISIHKTCGMSSSDTIRDAIDRLVDHGFIEIAEIGYSVKRTSHEIALTKNWSEWGTPDFKPNNGRK